ncbi:hypothetical protein CRYUN_Cryun20dG0095300 [Craigia yunnanensis]
MASRLGVIYHSQYCSHSPSELTKPLKQSHPKLVTFKRLSNPNKSRFSRCAKQMMMMDICYYSEPKFMKTGDSQQQDRLLRDFDRLGVPLDDKNHGGAFDVIFDSVSITTTHKQVLEEDGVNFCPISEAISKYPDLLGKYLGKVVPPGDNYYAALNSAVFSSGSFCYIPKDTKCLIPLTSYFRVNALETGQFERTLIIADERSVVEYVETCTAQKYRKNQLHAAVVELYCAEDAQIKYSTVQNWYAGEENEGGIYSFVTKKGFVLGLAQRSIGHKWRQGQPSHGSTQVLF